MSHSLEASRQSLTVHGPLPAGSAVSVLLSGRRIWTFKVPDPPSGRREDDKFDDDQFTVPWPAALAERLTGHARLALAAGGTLLTADRHVSFDDSGAELLLQEPGTGIPLVVNKWGRIARSFEGRDPSLLRHVLDATEQLVRLVREVMGLELFVTGGTLLGPVRDGKILPNDDDADLAYLSSHGNPSDIALESFELQRRLVDAGYEVVRHSSGHLQLMFPGGSATDEFYLDIFTYFVTDGWFYGTFHAREPAGQVQILPLRSLDVNGRSLPGPARPEQLLTAIYGPGWRTPDPAFRFVTPPAAARRYFWWLNSFDVDRENWEDHHRGLMSAGGTPGPSDTAHWAAGLLEPGAPVLELGCGLGADALFLARRGHRVLAADYSRPALHFARAAAGRQAERPVFERINLNMMREAARLRRLAAGLEETSAPAACIYARHLFDSLSPLGWDTALQLMRSVLRSGGTAFLEVETGAEQELPGWTCRSIISAPRLSEQLHRYGLMIARSTEHPSGGAGGTTIQRLAVRGDNV